MKSSRAHYLTLGVDQAPCYVRNLGINALNALTWRSLFSVLH